MPEGDGLHRAAKQLTPLLLGKQVRALTLPRRGRPGEPCYDCETPIRMQRQGGHDRSTYYCPGCQPARGAA